VLTYDGAGQGLDLVRQFYSLLPQRQRWVEAQSQAAEFIIDETFGVPGVGTVVAGETPEAGCSLLAVMHYSPLL